ncbi:PH domain-containing protein [Bacillus coahuilensis]|uniref:PH domain-containing protein n=1 Tax=Bacillus coahuilensis TaxID=408580 RepID=UPI0001851418
MLLIIFWLVLILFLAWILSIIRTIIKFGSFELHADKGSVYIRKGFFEKKEMIVSINDIKAIRIEENIFRQMFGYACIYIECSSGETDNRSVSTIFHPFLRLKDIEGLLKSFSLPYPALIPTYNLPNNSRIRYIFRALLVGLVLVTCLMTILNIPIIIYVPILIVCSYLGNLQYKETSYGFSESNFLLKRRLINKNTMIIKRKHIESIHFYQSFFQRKKNLKNLKLTILSNVSKKRYGLKDFSDFHGPEIHQWYRNKNNKYRE